MTWYAPPKQAAVDPDNPGANEQLPYDEYNALVAFLYDSSTTKWKLIDKVVNDAAIADDKILVYKVASDSFVFETPSVIAALNDLTDVTISGVPANDEVLAYHTGTGWVNQTAAEAELATTTQLTALETAAVLNADYNATTFLYATADDTPQPKTPAEVMAILSGKAGAEFLFNTQKLGGIVDPTTAQQAATKNYDDTHLFAKEVVTSFTNGYVPVYRTGSGKFVMEDAGGSAGLPVVDTTSIVKGSADGTKLMRFEVDGLTTGTTRVMTVPDKNMTIADKAEVMLLDGSQAMAAHLDMGNYSIKQVVGVCSYGPTGSMYITGSESGGMGGRVYVYGYNHSTYPGAVHLQVPNAAHMDWVTALAISGNSDTPIVDITHGLDMNSNPITGMKNSAPTALSGTQKDIEIDIGGTPYYFTVYPTKA